RDLFPQTRRTGSVLAGQSSDICKKKWWLATAGCSQRSNFGLDSRLIVAAAICRCVRSCASIIWCVSKSDNDSVWDNRTTDLVLRLVIHGFTGILRPNHPAWLW